MMEFLHNLGIIFIFASIFFAFVGILTFFKLKKLYSLLNEEELKQAEDIINTQKRRIKICTFICIFLGISVLIISVLINCQAKCNRN